MRELLTNLDNKRPRPKDNSIGIAFRAASPRETIQSFFAIKPILASRIIVCHVVQIPKEEIQQKTLALSKLSGDSNDTDLKENTVWITRNQLAFFPATFGSQRILSSASMFTRKVWSSSTGLRILIAAGWSGKGISSSFVRLVSTAEPLSIALKWKS